MKHFLPAIILLLFPGFRSTAQSVRADQENKPALMACVSACQGVLGENIYPNGDFGAGQPNVILVDPGLAPGYLYQPSPPPNDGYYTIANNTASWGWFAGNLWINIEDNGPEPNGYMMVVNASYAPGMFFQNTVAVCENTMYEFSIDVINVFESAYTQSIKPNLTFLVDGIAYCETGDIPIDEQWHTARFSFTTSPGQTSVVLGMRNNAPGGYGNDLAIDNISFRACGPELIAQDSAWFCPGSPTSLDVQLLNSPFDTTVYQWQIWANNAWEDIPGADSVVLSIADPQHGQQYRLLAASALSNLQALNCRAVSQTIRLFERPPLHIQMTGEDATCFGYHDAAVQAQTTQGTAPFSYLWNTGADTALIAGLPPGIYSVTTTDAHGCTGTASASVSEPAALMASLSATPVSCHLGSDGQALASPSGGAPPYVFSWENNTFGETLQQVSAGNYGLTVTDTQGCTFSATVSITGPEALTASTTTSPVSCFGGQDAVAAVAAGGGTAPYTFSWGSGQSNTLLTGLAAGVYEVTVTDAMGCTNTALASIGEPAPLLISTSVQDVSCFGFSDGGMLVTASGGAGGYQVTWHTAETTAQIQGLPAGPFAVTVSDENGCSATATGAVNQPAALTLDISTTTLHCFAGHDAWASATASGGTAPFTFVWSSGQAGQQAAQLPAGPISVTVTDAQGCTLSAEAAITQPPPMIATLSGTDVACFGNASGAAEVEANGGTAPYQFHWSNGQYGPQTDGLSAGQYSVTVTDLNGCSITENLQIQEPPALTASVSTEAPACFGHQTGRATANASGGTAPYQYQWSNGQTASQIAGLGAGVFQVTVSDDLGCTVITTLEIPEPPALNLVVSGTAVDCFGGNNAVASAVVNGGTAPYSFLWNDGQNTAQAVGLSAGAYALTVTDAQGCTRVENLQIEQSPALIAQAGSTAGSCYNSNDGTAWITAQGGTGPYIYQWSHGIAGPSTGNLAAGVYTVTVVDAKGCTRTSSVMVEAPAPVQIELVPVNISCAGGTDGMVTAIPEGGTGPYQLWWSNEQSGTVVDQLIAGVYALSVSDSHGCTGTAEITLTEPPPLTTAVTTQDVACFGGADGSAVLMPGGGVPPYFADWQSGQQGLQISALQAGQYAATLTDSHGCNLVVAAAVEQPAAALSGQIQTQGVACFGDDSGAALVAAVGGAPPYSFNWHTGQTTPQLEALAAGWYVVTVTDDHQCTATVLAWVDQPPPVQLQISTWPSACEAASTGKAVALASGGIGPYAFAWSNGMAAASLSALPVGAYTVTVTDLNGCTEEAMAQIGASVPPEVELGLDQTVNLGEEIVLRAQTTLPAWRVARYEWQGDAADKTCTDCDELVFQPLEDGCEAVEVHSIEGCIARDEVCYDVIPGRNIYVPNIFHPDGDGENDYFTIYSDASVSHIRYLRVYDRWGSQVFEAEDIKTNHEPSGWDGAFRGQPMNPAVFAWVAVVVFIDGEAILLKGDVTLYR